MAATTRAEPRLGYDQPLVFEAPRHKTVGNEGETVDDKADGEHPHNRLNRALKKNLREGRYDERKAEQGYPERQL